MFNLHDFRQLSQAEIEKIAKSVDSKDKKISPQEKWRLALCKINGVLITGSLNEGLKIAFEVCISAREYAEMIMPLLSYIIPGDIQKSTFTEFSEMALSDNEEVQTMLGICFEFGFGISIDKDKAFASYLFAAKKNYPSAKDIVGTCYHLGIGTPKDDRISFQYFEAAANQGFAPAENNVGRCYQLNRGVVFDYKMAFEYYSRSAKQGFAPGENHLALCFDKGIGTSPDIHKMLQFFKFAAAQQFLPAQYNYGTYFEEQKDFNNAFYYYELSANQKYAPAQFKLACCFERGIGVLKNHKRAIEYYKRAQENGSQEAKQALTVIDVSSSISISTASAGNYFLPSKGPLKRTFSEMDGPPISSTEENEPSSPSDGFYCSQ